MIEQGLSASTINVRLAGISKLIREACDNNLLDPVEAARMVSVPSVSGRSVRLGVWLTAELTRQLLATADRSTLKGKRDFAILSLLAICALCRSEFAALDYTRIQQRECRWVIADLVGKGGRVRTVAIPMMVKEAIDAWTKAAGILCGPLFRRLSRGGAVMDDRMSGWAVWSVVVAAARAAGINHLGAHDLRRTRAQLCRSHGGKLEQIQFLLGHASIETTERYLGSRQQIAVAVNDGPSLHIDGDNAAKIAC